MFLQQVPCKPCKTEKDLHANEIWYIDSFNGQLMAEPFEKRKMFVKSIG